MKLTRPQQRALDRLREEYEHEGSGWHQFRYPHEVNCTPPTLQALLKMELVESNCAQWPHRIAYRFKPKPEPMRPQA